MMILAVALAALAAIPALLLAVNLFCYRRLPRVGLHASGAPRSGGGVSVLIPARNEERAIGRALASVLAGAPAAGDFEVLILDDQSTDRTADVVRAWSERDPRVRLVKGAALPAGWCGKQHACWQLASHARHDLLVFVDADVRLAPDALPRLQSFFAARPELHLASGVPWQRLGTFTERLLIPLIHVVLLEYLPIPFARRFRGPAFAAGCGQLFVARREAYFAAGGHDAIRATLHDGLQLPRLFRRHGFGTDLFDATDVAECRMYQGAAEVWRGLGKNATEGLAHPAAIVPWTLLLLGGHVLPILWLALGPLPSPAVTGLLAAATGISLAGRAVVSLVFRQSWLGVVFHPLSVLLLVAIQWQALFRHWRGRPRQWRGRHYPQTSPTIAEAHPPLAP